MQSEPAPRRVLLKLSGAVFAGRDGEPFGRDALDWVASEVAEARRICPQMAIVVGGGNIMRGAHFCPEGHGRLLADYAGMLATAINALLLRHALECAGLAAAHYGAFPVPRMVPQFDPERAIADLRAGAVVVLAGGTGNPLLTTDTAAALRAGELGADLMLKATRVDGVYSADPETDPDAQLFEELTYRQVLQKRLGVMDLTAVSLCMQQGLPVRVFNYSVAGNIRRAAAGEPVGTLIAGPFHEDSPGGNTDADP
ncbi:MAG: uridine monophosphate kinase [Candidatus Brocadiia bacterium]